MKPLTATALASLALAFTPVTAQAQTAAPRATTQQTQQQTQAAEYQARARALAQQACDKIKTDGRMLPCTNAQQDQLTALFLREFSLGQPRSAAEAQARSQRRNAAIQQIFAPQAEALRQQQAAAGKSGTDNGVTAQGTTQTPAPAATPTPAPTNTPVAKPTTGSAAPAQNDASIEAEARQRVNTVCRERSVNVGFAACNAGIREKLMDIFRAELKQPPAKDAAEARARARTRDAAINRILPNEDDEPAFAPSMPSYRR